MYYYNMKLVIFILLFTIIGCNTRSIPILFCDKHNFVDGCDHLNQNTVIEIANNFSSIYTKNYIVGNYNIFRTRWIPRTLTCDDFIMIPHQYFGEHYCYHCDCVEAILDVEEFSTYMMLKEFTTTPTYNPNSSSQTSYSPLMIMMIIIFSLVLCIKN